MELVAFNVVDVMLSLLNHFPTVAYSRSRLYRSCIKDMEPHLISYLFSHPKRFKLGLIPKSGACFILWPNSMETMMHKPSDGVGAFSPLTENKYLAIMRQIPFGIEFFVLDVADGKFMLPYLTLQRKKSDNANTIRPEPDQVIAMLQRDIKDLVQRANDYYSQDLLWKTLLESSTLEPRDVLANARQFYFFSIATLDNRLQNLLSVPGDWRGTAI
jgi:hypothetical protein